MPSKSPFRRFIKGVGGFGAVEAAILMPLFLGILFGVIDYGMLMTNRTVGAYSLGTLARSIQDNPNISANDLNDLVAGAGSGIVNFNASGNCVCSNVFVTYADAKTFSAQNTCSPCPRNTTAAKPYYIGVRGVVTYNYVTPLNEIMQNLTGSSSAQSNTKVLEPVT